MPTFEDPGELQPKDWPGGPPLVLDYLGRASRRIRDFLRTRLSLSTNIDCDVQTVRCTHGQEVRIKSRLLSVRGLSVLSASNGLQVEFAKLVASGPTARVTVYFAGLSGSTDVTLVLWPEGNAGGSGLTYYPCLRPGSLSGSAGMVLTNDPTQPSGAKWAPAAGGSTGGLSQVDYMQVRRWGAAFASSVAANTIASFGMNAPTLTGAATTSPFAARNMVALTPAAAVAGTVGGLTGPYTETRPGYSNKFGITILTDAAGTLNMLHCRQWFGLASAAGVGAIAPGAGASVLHFAVIGYDTDVSPNWKFMTGDGTNYSTTDLGVAVAAATYHLLVLDWTTKATPTATIYDAPFDTNTFSLLVGPTGKSTNITASTAINLGLNATVTLGENASKAVYFSKLMLEQN